MLQKYLKILKLIRMTKNHKIPKKKLKKYIILELKIPEIILNKTQSLESMLTSKI